MIKRIKLSLPAINNKASELPKLYFFFLSEETVIRNGIKVFQPSHVHQVRRHIVLHEVCCKVLSTIFRVRRHI